MPPTKRWSDHELVLATQICTSTTELCHWLGLYQGGSAIRDITVHAKRLGLQMPERPRTGAPWRDRTALGNGWDHQLVFMPRGLLRQLCQP
jgi:hypothetical protein